MLLHRIPAHLRASSASRLVVSLPRRGRTISGSSSGSGGKKAAPAAAAAPAAGGGDEEMGEPVADSPGFEFHKIGLLVSRAVSGLQVTTTVDTYITLPISFFFLKREAGAWRRRSWRAW